MLTFEISVIHVFSLFSSLNTKSDVFFTLFSELRDWMKSLRLHKYTERLVGLSQEQLLNLGDQELLQMGFTDGAKGKFIKQIKLVKDRPELIKQFRKSLEVRYNSPNVGT